MPRSLCCFFLVLAAHAGLGWLLHELLEEQGVALQVPEAMLIQLVAPEPAAVPVPQSAPARVAAAKPARPSREHRPQPRSQVMDKPRLAVTRPAARPRPASAEPVESKQPVAVAPVPAARPEETPGVVHTPAAAAKPVAMEVFSREPAFLEPPRPPVYPAKARRRNQQGLVLVEVRLDARGLQKEIRLLRSSGVESLDRAALDAVAAWRFRPETQNGQPVPSRVHIPIDFALSASR